VYPEKMANDFKDYYSILEVEKTATAQDIKKAYRKLARKYHPDVSPTTADKFKEINEANEVLGDPEKRKKYDEYGTRYKEHEQWQKAGGANTGVPFDATTRAQPGGSNPQYRTVSPEDLQDMFGDDSPFSDFFYSMFGGQEGAGSGFRQSATKANRGRDQEYPLEISLEEAFNGSKRVLSLSGGPGQPVRRLEVSIPAGVDNGSRVRLAGLGEPGRDGGSAGDLYLLVAIATHPVFERKGADLYAKVDVPMTIALLGGEVMIPTVRGTKLALKISASTQNGNPIRLRGQGMPAGTTNQRGDLYAIVNVVLPTDLTAEERDLLEQFVSLRHKHQNGGAAA